jgi:hypothetical protein
MIGVVANEAEWPVICEFFELFKTPWEFYRSGCDYDVILCSKQRFRNSSAKLVLIYSNEENEFDREKGIEILSRRSNRVLFCSGDRIPIYGNCLTFRRGGTHGLVEDRTREPAEVQLCAGKQTFVRIGFDLFHEIRHLLTHGQPLVHARIPTLELHIELLRDLILSCSIPLVEIPPSPAGYNFIACLTHDVDHVGIRFHKFDHTMFGFLYRATIGSLINFCTGRRSAGYVAANWMAAFSLPFVHLGLAKDFWNDFDRYLDIESGLNSTFFVIPKKGDPGRNPSGPAPSRRATRYDVTQIADQIQHLVSARREIALHGIDAWRDVNKGRAELATIQRVTGKSEIGVRMHWLFFDENSPVTLEEAGFSYDSTVGYNETAGYRAGTTQAFRPLGATRMLELPMHIMDTALFYPVHMNLSPGQAETLIGQLINNASHFGGVLTINWHDRSVAPERLWGGVYNNLLDDLKKMGAWFPTAAQAVSWFKKRRSAVIENVAREAETIRVKVSLDNSDDDLPGLRIRVHKPSAQKPSLPREVACRDQFAEVALNCSKEVEIAL